MKVKVGNKIYDGVEERIMVILTDKDKENITNMHPEATRYASFDSNIYTKEDTEEWMREGIDG